MMRMGAGLAAVVLMGCAGMKVLNVDGYEVRQEEWNDGARRVASLASHDMSCSEDVLELRLLDAKGYLPVSIGVSGCGTSARYTRVSGTYTWELNSHLTTDDRVQKSLLIGTEPP